MARAYATGHLSYYGEPMTVLHESDWLPLGTPTEVGPHVYQVPVLRPEACARFLSQVDRRQADLTAPLQAPNSMHEHGVNLAALGFGLLLDEIHARLAPVAQRLLPEFAPYALDTHHSYLVDYSRDTDEELGFHVDDSEVTINLCLGDHFRGAELMMMGLRCDLHRQTAVRPHEEIEVVHSIGHAVLHAGRHRHRVDPIRSGRRRNLIIWSRSSMLRSAPQPLACTPWCAYPS